MAPTIYDLYTRYTEDTEKMSEDRYYQYLFELVNAGDKEFTQNFQVLHKVVDEEWINMVEEGLEAMFKIIEQPRSFIKREDEVVPVELAKKINKDSVIHLSMHTENISTIDEAGNVKPNKVLNVHFEDSFNLYENRFIYHLIHKVLTFVDKRSDILMNDTGDETQSVVTMVSHMDDMYETIDYRMEMTVKNLQTYSENDDENAEIFKRIDRIRRLTLALRGSKFCEIMSGCSPVKNPIQRTNLLIKDPDYRKCYDLWNFIERYTGVGYTIEVKNSVLDFGDDYLRQLYSNLIANYVTVKSLTDDDNRGEIEDEVTRERNIRPIFNKEIVEQIVDDYDIEEVEIKKVIIEEVTQAQLDAEAKLEEETKARIAAEKERDEAKAEIEAYRLKAEAAEQEKQEAIELRAAAEFEYRRIEGKLERERSEKDTLSEQVYERDMLIKEKNAQLKLSFDEYAGKLEEQRAEYERRISKIEEENEQDYSTLVEQYRTNADKLEFKLLQQMDQNQNDYAVALEKLQETNEAALSENIEKYEAKLLEADEKHRASLAEEKAMYDEYMDRQQAEYTANLASQRDELTGVIKTKEEEHAKALSETEEKHQAEMAEAKKTAADVLKETKNAADAKLKEERREARRKFDELKNRDQEELRNLRAANEQAVADLKDQADRRVHEERAKQEARFEAYRSDAEAKYQALKTNSEFELQKTKKNAEDSYSLLKSAKDMRETELTAEIDRMKRELEALERDQKALKSQLAEESALRRTAESRAQAEEALRNAVEEKVTAQTVSDFRRALKAEKKARKQK